MVVNASVANMSDRDNKILISTIDLDCNGALDFIELCTAIPVSDERKRKGSNQEKDGFTEA